MNKITSNEIILLLNDIIKNPKPELDFNNNYELLVAVVLSAQTTDKRVNIVSKDLFKKYPSFNELKDANNEELINIIKPLGLANNKAKSLIELSNQIVSDFNGIVPNNLNDLTKLKGVGRKTANVVLALGFNIPAFPVDTHVERIAKRLGYAKFDDDIILVENKLKKYIDKDKWILSHHLFLLFGRYHCKAINPMCIDCKLKKYCKKR